MDREVEVGRLVDFLADDEKPPSHEETWSRHSIRHVPRGRVCRTQHQEPQVPALDES